MSAAGDADSQPPVERKDGDVKQEPCAGYPAVFAGASSSSGLDAVGGATEEASRVSDSEARGFEDKAALNPNKANLNAVPIAARSDDNTGKLDFIAPKVEHKKIVSVSGDYDSMLSEFDQFAYRGGGEPVGYGYGIGDMVWGKVKSHPWWPGQIFNELLASPSVRSSKRDGHVLVAFFGDSSYGWFDPAELVPFVECFAEKSSQSSQRAFLNAVKEAVDELSRRKSLGLACRCRNEFNFWPFRVEGYYTVHAGNHDPGVYSLSQINKSREEFRPREMLAFVYQLALRPAGSHLTIDFIKNKATVLAYRKARYEEFDDTYAQAFGTVPDRPSRPTAPLSMDPSGASLSGRLVIAEALGKRKHPLQHNQTEDQTEKDKYLFKKRDEFVEVKPKKAAHPQLVDPLLCATNQQSFLSGFRTQLASNESYIVFGNAKPFEDSGKRVVEMRKEKVKVPKQRAAESGAVRAAAAPSGEPGKKRKKETNSQAPVVVDLLAPSLNLVKKKRKKVMRGGSSIPHLQALQMSINGPPPVSTPPPAQQAAEESRKAELGSLLRDLRSLALNPFSGIERVAARQAVLKYRCLVFQRGSLSEKEAAAAAALEPATPAAAVSSSSEKPAAKPAPRPAAAAGRPDDPTRGGKKRVSSDRPETAKKKKAAADEPTKDAEEKKKKVTSIPPPRKPPPAAISSETGGRKPAKVRRRTALMLKFPKGSSLPSGAELAAKFARFGPLEYPSTRVYWQTDTCRIVFLYKVDAEAALKFAASSDSMFGYENVKPHIRDAAFEGTEVDTGGGKAAAIRRLDESAAPRVAPAQPLKSILKKQSGEEGGKENGGGGGGGGGGRRRVKFVLSGDDGVEQNSNSFSMDFSGNDNKGTVAAVGGSRMNRRPQETGVVFPTVKSPAAVDISGELLGLLNRCRDVVNDVRKVFGYVPYHSL